MKMQIIVGYEKYSFYFFLVLFVAFAVSAGVAFVQTMLTKDDAFYIVGRKKSQWALMLGLSTLLFVLTVMTTVRLPLREMFIIAALVILGVYWQDIRPSIRNLNGNTSILNLR